MMQMLLTLSRYIDKINEKIGITVKWALLAAVVVCTANALVRYSFHIGSNAWLEIQWYLFSAMFLLSASYTLKCNEHIRIDVIASRFSKRTQAWIDILGFMIFVIPMSLILIKYSVPYFYNSFLSHEMSPNAGGLLIWPAKALIPISFLMLLFQGISEIIKRVGFIMNMVDPIIFEKPGNQSEVAVMAGALPSENGHVRGGK